MIGKQDLKDLEKYEEKLREQINSVADQINTLKTEYDELVNARNTVYGLITTAKHI